jgi:rubrerythrin
MAKFNGRTVTIIAHQKGADAKEMLATAIEFERFGIEYYRKFHELVGDEKAKPLMKGLAGDEEEHARILEEELRKLGGKPAAPSKEVMKKGLAEIFLVLVVSVRVMLSTSYAHFSKHSENLILPPMFFTRVRNIAKGATRMRFDMR